MMAMQKGVSAPGRAVETSSSARRLTPPKSKRVDIPTPFGDFCWKTTGRLFCCLLCASLRPLKLAQSLFRVRIVGLQLEDDTILLPCLLVSAVTRVGARPLQQSRNVSLRHTVVGADAFESLDRRIHCFPGSFPFFDLILRRGRL